MFSACYFMDWALHRRSLKTDSPEEAFHHRHERLDCSSTIGKTGPCWLDWSQTIAVQLSTQTEQAHAGRINLLAGFHITVTGKELPGFHQQRLQQLLAYLLINRQQPQSRQHIAFLFWPDSTERQAQTNLRKLIHMLRKVLPEAERCLQISATTLHWLPASPYDVDLVWFERFLTAAKEQTQAARQCHFLEEAIALYRGDLLPQHASEWIENERYRLREAFEDALTRLIRLLEKRQHYDKAVGYARRLLQQDRFQESSYRILMRLYLLQDDRASALRVFHDCATLLSEELGVDPSLSTQQLHLTALNLEDDTVQETFPRSNPSKLKLIGREDAWQTLTSAWSRAQGGRASLLLIQGEAGIGKTRLAEELVDNASRLGGSALHTRAYAAVGSAAYAPIASLLRSAPLQDNLNRLDDVWLVELSRLLPELRVGRPALPEPVPITESWQQRRFYEAMSRLVLLQDDPLLIHFDDLQWSDPESIAWLQFLLHFNQQAQILVVGTVRADEIDESHPIMKLHLELHRRRRSTAMELGPLLEADTARLAADLLEYELSEAEISSLQSQTEGSPLYTIELLRARSQRANGSDPQTLPSSIETVIQWRLQQLSEQARALLEAAAVIGRSFTHELLRTVSDVSEDTLIHSLDELWRRRIIRERGAVSYDFHHDFIRDVTYRSISPGWLRVYHRRTAEALLTLGPTAIDENSGRIAAHFAAAGLLAEAREYYERAGDHAAKKHASKEALAYYDLAMPSWSEKTLADRFELHLKREDAIRWTNEVHTWRAELHEITKLAERLRAIDNTNVAPTIEALIRLNLYERMSSNTLQYAHLEEAIALAQRSNEVELEIRALTQLGAAQITESDYPAAKQALERAFTMAEAHSLEELALRAREHYAVTFMFSGGSQETIEAFVQPLLAGGIRSGSVDLEAACYNKLAYVIVAQGDGDYERAEQYYHRGLELAQNHVLVFLECLISGNLGVLYTHTGDYRKAHKALSLALTRAEETQLPHWQGPRFCYLAGLLFNIGQYEEARRTYRHSLDHLKHMPNNIWIGKVHSELGLMAFTLSHYEQALQHFEKAIVIMQDSGDVRQLAETLTRQGRTLAALGQLSASRQAFHQALEIHQELSQANRAIMAVAGLAECALAAGELDEAIERAEQVITHLDHYKLNYTDEALAVYMSTFYVLEQVGDQRATSMLQQALDHLQKRANSLTDEAMVKRFWDAPPHQAVIDAANTYIPEV